MIPGFRRFATKIELQRADQEERDAKREDGWPGADLESLSEQGERDGNESRLCHLEKSRPGPRNEIDDPQARHQKREG